MATTGSVTPHAAPQQSGSAAAGVFVAILVIIGFAVFFVSFLLAPLVIIGLGYLLLVANERASKGNRPAAPQEIGNSNLDRSARLDREREVRRRALRNGNGNGPAEPAQVEPVGASRTAA